MTPGATHDAVTGFLSALAGKWEGRGEGGFPTLEPFDYRERLRFTHHDDQGILHYVQETWRLIDGGEVRSHWEAGFLRARDDGSIELLDAQESGRTEILRGRPLATGEGAWEVTLDSVSIGGDARMVGSTRTLRLDGATLHYEMSMATDRVPAVTRHLEATLTRVE